MPINRRIFLGALGTAALRVPLLARGKKWTLEPDSNGKALKTPDGMTVFTYLTQKPPRIPLAGNNACCFHPVNSLSGERVSDIAPSDHRDHRGAFLAWANMEFHRKNGTVTGDFWGWGHFASIKDRLIVNRDVRLAKSNAKFAEVNVLNDWKIAGEKVLDENTIVRVHQKEGVRILDFVFRVSSDGDVIIRQTAFTGFAFRCFSNSKGRINLPGLVPFREARV